MRSATLALVCAALFMVGAVWFAQNTRPDIGTPSAMGVTVGGGNSTRLTPGFARAEDRGQAEFTSERKARHGAVSVAADGIAPAAPVQSLGDGEVKREVEYSDVDDYDDSDADEDNSGPGSGDDEPDEDNSGPGGGGDPDEGPDDSSGPGSGDEPDEDNSGPGSGD